MKQIYWIAIFYCLSLNAQEDSLRVQDFDSVNISFVIVAAELSTQKHFLLNKKEIEDFQLNDAGELIQKFSGTTMKSYGGLGGLKTVSMRGLGANHTSVIVDGFPINNTQTGQVNLSQVQVDNIETIGNSMINEVSYLAPVSSQVAGSSISISTFSDTKATDKLALRGNIKYGSFNQKDINLSAKYGFNKMFISAFGKYRNADGDYSYSYMNGATEVSAIRKNNDYLDYYYGAVVGWDLARTTKFRIGYKTSTIDQGLPGAVILYNETADERLFTSDHTIYSEFVKVKEKGAFRGYGSFNKNDMNYLDPSFLNNYGGINVDYKNLSGIIGASFDFNLNKHFNFNWGVEQQINDLKSSDTLFANPIRFHNFGLVGAKCFTKKLMFTAKLSSQYITENNRTGSTSEDKIELNPFLKVETINYNRVGIKHQLWYRNSFRMPTFNELYYNNIGNTALDPEKANQFNYTVSYKNKNINKLRVFVLSSLFFNRVHDRIVAIPTKNLFVWSMQNIGITNTYGGDVSLKFKRKFTNILLELGVNYTFNKTIDVTDEEMPTYGHQVAYIPIHTSNFDFSLMYKKIGFRISNYATSLRYALNENVPQNEVSGFLITDLTAFIKVPIQEKNKIAVRFTVKNIFNQSYSYVRSYVMPGINYLISINYAFN